MQSLLLDVGNSAIKMALADHNGLFKPKAWPSNSSLANLEIGIDKFIAENNCTIQSILICSVVPTLTTSLKKILERKLTCQIFLVPKDLSLPLGNKYLDPKQLGSDRLVAAFAAYKLYPSFASQLIVDIGTAITLDVVYDRSFQGGLILPGPQISLQALAEKTAQLPEIKFQTTPIPFRLGRSTLEGIKIGSYFSTIFQIEGLIGSLKKELGDSCIVIATGGLANDLAKATPIFDVICPNLVLEGLRFLI